MADARSSRNSGKERILATGTIGPYEVIQSPSGRAGVNDSASAFISGDYVELTTLGSFTCTKTSGFVALKGNRAYWDHSANAITYKKVNDRDFYVGRFTRDSGNTDTECEVDFNIDPPYDLDLMRDPYTTTPVGTQALGGFLPPQRRGGALHFALTSTNEAQKIEAISVDGFATGANAIIEFAFRVISDGSGSAVDVSLGVANGTNATDADSITESIFCHLDANNTNINFESDDGSTEVAATDSTTDYTEGSTVSVREEIWLDMRDPADVQIYRNGVLMLGSTVFNVNAATGPWYLLAHVEKTSSTDTYDIAVDWMRAHYAEQ